MYVEKEKKRKGLKPIVDQYRVTTNYVLKYKFILLFKKGLLVSFIIYPLERIYSCLDMRS